MVIAKSYGAGATPIDLKRGIDAAAEAVIAEINRMAKPVTTREEWAKVASISANNEENIGELVADAMEKVRKDGVIQIEEAKSAETKVRVTEGMLFDRGYVSPYFVYLSPTHLYEVHRMLTKNGRSVRCQ